MTIATIDRTAPAVHLRIGDQHIPVGSGGSYTHVNPSTGQVDGTIPLAGPSEIGQAVRVAHEAFASWRHTSPTERRRLLLKLGDLVERDAHEIARLTSIENGTLYNPAMSMAWEWIRYYAGWPDKLAGEVHGTYGTGGEFSYTLAEPYGVIGIITTWNGMQIASIAMKAIPAVAAGNTVVIKPSELSPFSGEKFASLVEEAGFPPGVFNVVPGSREAGEALVRHPLVRKISFTGGPITARKILQACAQDIKPAILELGGKSANILFDDADLDLVCNHGTLMSVGFLAGQGCLLPTRMLVQRSIYREVVERVRAIAESFPIGDPFDPATVVGPVITESALDRIIGMIDRTKAGGSTLVTGGSRVGGSIADGFFIRPTVFSDVDPSCELAQNEVFGPVLSIIPFDTEEQAVEIANGTPYSLAAYIGTNDLSRTHRLAENLVAGEILVNGAHNVVPNRPFGGTGLSGFGKEGGRQGIDEFLRVKSVGISAGNLGMKSMIVRASGEG